MWSDEEASIVKRILIEYMDKLDEKILAENQNMNAILNDVDERVLLKNAVDKM